MAGVCRVDEQALGASLRMYSDDGVSGASVLGNGIGILLWRGSAKAIAEFCGAAEIVNCSEAFEIQLHVWRQRVVGGGG